MNAASGTKQYLSPLNVWALSLGCIIGWGAFVMPGTTLLPLAGPVGTITALCLGAAAMLIIAVNLCHMANRYPDSGGAFSYTKHVFGYDHAFLCAWSLVLAYIAILWANATAFVLIGRFLLGPVFQFGFHYVVAGYDVYFGEILVTLAVLGVFGFISCLRRRVVSTLNTGFALTLFFGVVLCLLIVLMKGVDITRAFNPPFAKSVSPTSGIFGIFALAPWAFVGFESVSHGVSEMRFPVKRLLSIVMAAIFSGALIYIFTSAISVLGTPDTYNNWLEYVLNLGNHSGIDGLPVFHAMWAAAGQPGLALLAFAVLSALATSLIGLYRAASRLLCNIAEDGILPEWLAQKNEEGTPVKAVLFILAISVVVPFVGRAAIGWIVDVTSICASIAYCYISLCAYRVGRDEGKRAIAITGIVGAVLSAVFFIFPLIPYLWSVSALATESYLIFATWSVLGLVFFRIVFKQDTTGRFGRSTIVWMAMLFLILFSSTMWVRQSAHDNLANVVIEIDDYFEGAAANRGIYFNRQDLADHSLFLNGQSQEIQQRLMRDSLVQLGLIVFSLAIMFRIYSLMLSREKEHDLQRIEAEQMSKAKSEFLSSMSHDIRTPMNAIVGYTHIALREGTSLEETREYLNKIDASSRHLLALINDVLDMSRIESGKMELDPIEMDLCGAIDEVHDIFATQMHEKDIAFTVDTSQVTNPYVLCDKNRLDRVLLNLLSNAYKFTPEGGTVGVTVTQTGHAGEGLGRYEIRVKDNGIGMTKEFAEHVFEAFEREHSSTVNGIQGTGLGMSITKNIVDLMGGTIDVETAPNEGTEFIIRVDFPIVAQPVVIADVSNADEEQAPDFTGKRILVAEDNEINMEIATFVLEDLGFEVDTAINGKIAVDKVANSTPGYYDALLTDIWMPEMNGYEAVHAIRNLPDAELASIPIVACSAHAFAEDVEETKAAGMNAHLTKPLDVPRVIEVFTELFGEAG